LKENGKGYFFIKIYSKGIKLVLLKLICTFCTNIIIHFNDVLNACSLRAV